MGTDPVLTALAFHRCGEADSYKIAVRDGFVSYDCYTAELYGLSKEVVQERKRVRDEDGIPTTVTL